MRRAASTLVVVIAAAIALTACGGRDEASDSYGERNAIDVNDSRVTVEMTNLQFAPKGIRIKPGTTVSWVNKDVALHNVSSIDQVFLSAPQGDMKQGDTFSYTFNTPGTFRYQCTFHHPNMNGVVIVEDT